MRLKTSTRRINAFKKRFGLPHFYLACHAALPLALTPDLLYRIWANFRRDINNNFIDIPWIAVSDLILSSLCDEVGYELYEMDATVRDELLEQLKQEPQFGERRLKQVAHFLLKYVRRDLDNSESYYREFAESQSWAALAYTKPLESVQLLAAEFERAYRENPADLMRLVSLTEMLHQPIPEFDKLRIFARAIGHLKRKRLEEAKQEMTQLPVRGGLVSLSSNIVLSVPTELLDQVQIEKVKLVQSLFTVRGQSKATRIILSNHRHLMTNNFLQTIKQVASFMSHEQNEELANWFGNIAAQVSENVVATSPYIQLLGELLQIILDNKGNSQVIFTILSQNIDKLNREFGQVMESWAREIFPDMDDKTKQTVVEAIAELSSAIQQFPLGSRFDNLEIAIIGYNLGLTVFEPETFPASWANLQNNLGTAYSDRIRGDRAENLEMAIACYQAALEVYTRTAFPENWASVQNNLGTAYSNRIRGERSENLEVAIACYQAALEVRTRHAFPYEWAMTQNNLAVAYSDRIRGERSENLENAIACYQAALEVYTPDAFPENWALTQNNQGTAYSDRIRGERSENLENAIACYQATLEVRTRHAFPEDWATTQNNLGNAYSDRIRGERSENLEMAIACCHNALEVYTRDAFPQQHTVTLNNLGFAYQKQSQHYSSDFSKKQTALQNAYNSFEHALDTVEYLRGEIASGEEAKRKLNEEWNKLYRGIVEVCLELGNHTAALEYTDRSKARNLVELIATRDAYPGGTIPPEVRQRLQELRQGISEENRRLQQDPNPDYTHIDQLRREYQAQFPYQPLNWTDIQSLLDEDTAILEWYILPNQFLTFTLTRQGLHLWQSSEADRNNLSDWAAQYRTAYYEAKEPLQKALTALKEATTETERQQAQELLAQAQAIWQNPLEERLGTLAQILHLDDILQNLFEQFSTCQKLILIPHLDLHLFPLHALPVHVSSPAEKSAGGGGNTLQEIFPKGVTYAPNCQLLQQAQRRTYPNFKRLLALQNPTEDLAFADLEVETIRTLFPERDSLQRQNATKVNLRAKDLRLIHHLFFSCHAGFNLTSPFDSGLLLADGILTLEEIIATLDLRECSLVTLSASETGQVALDTTDEYLSIASGFILAGSPSVLVSLWSVNQVSTALLLIKTYETLNESPGQLAIALKTAQIWLRDTTVAGFQTWVQNCPLLEEYWRNALAEFFQNMSQNEGEAYCPYQSPYHWAAFCVVGQGEQKNGA